VDFQPQPKQIDLLAEPLSDAEVRTLLERLGSREFGGPESATVGAVVEATGSDAETVGRLLAEIRKEDFEERFGLQLKDHGRRIETLEERSSRLERERQAERPRSYLRNEPEHDEYRERAINRLAEQERIAEESKPVASIVGSLFLLALVIYTGFVCAREEAKRPFVPPKSLYEHRKMDGTVIYDNPEGGGVFVKEPSGKVRPATESETSEWAAVSMARMKDR
jgi:hypothetical protein